MENTLIVKEERKTIDKFRNWYKTKFIETGISANLEDIIDKRVEIQKKTIKIAGTVATIVLLFCPSDGPFGETLTVLATPLLAKLVELKAELQKNAIIKTKRGFENRIIKEDGSSKNVNIPDFTLEELANDVKTVRDGVIKLTEMTKGK